MLQGKQRGTYLAEQSTGTTTYIIVAISVECHIRIAKMKLDDMACSVAATDASPPAAVLSLPRGKEVGVVACNALFEGEQGGPLSRDAATATAMGMLMMLGLYCTICDEWKYAYGDECKQEIGCARHARRTSFLAGEAMHTH